MRVEWRENRRGWRNEVSKKLGEWGNGEGVEVDERGVSTDLVYC